MRNMVPIIGRIIHDAPVGIRELREDMGLVTIQGEVSQLEKHELKDRQIQVITFIMTDHTSSVLCKAFLRRHYPGSFSKEGGADFSLRDEEHDTVLEKYNRIHECVSVRVRGVCEFDHLRQMLSVIIRDLAELKEEINYLVPEGTHRIVRHQFKNLELEEIALPEGLEWIGAHCFRLSKLRRLVLPSTVKRIDFGAFSACDWLEEVVLPEGIQEIGRYAFSECEHLKRVILPETAHIGEGAFYEYRLSRNCCPWCGTKLDKQGNCPRRETHARDWTGSLRLYRGLFWWNGDKLITVKVHCVQTGDRAYSVPYFGKRETLGSHQEEWDILKSRLNPDVKGVPRYNTFPRGRVEIENFKARVFLHPDLNTPIIRKKILNEFGLSQGIQNLEEIRFITDYSEHYHTSDYDR